MSETTNDQPVQEPAEPTVAEKRAWLQAHGKPVGVRGKLSKQAEQDYRDGHVADQPQR